MRQLVEASIAPLQFQDIAGTCGRDKCVCDTCWVGAPRNPGAGRQPPTRSNMAAMNERHTQFRTHTPRLTQHLCHLGGSQPLPFADLAHALPSAAGAMWDPSIVWHNGKFYAFMMYAKQGRNGGEAGHCLLATSTDGVHWQTEGVVNEERELAAGNKFFKCFVGRCGDRFVMDHGVARPRRQDLMRCYESADLRQWNYLFSSSPDPHWYGVPPQPARWDHMYILPKEEGNPGTHAASVADCLDRRRRGHHCTATARSTPMTPCSSSPRPTFGPEDTVLVSGDGT